MNTIHVIRKCVRSLIPAVLRRWVRSALYKKRLLQAYYYDYKRYAQHAGCWINGMNDRESEIIRLYHILEKGLTMPEMRLGFGQTVVSELCQAVSNYMVFHKTPNDQAQHAARVIVEYKNVHQRNGYQLESRVLSAIEKAASDAQVNSPSEQLEFSRTEYLSKTSAPFAEFAESRHSARNFDGRPIALDILTKVLEVARTTPSACNRQCWRTHVYTRESGMKEILDQQGGCRGFGHLADKLIVVCGKLTCFNEVIERNQAFIDGGLYAMNLLYSLHHYNIGACILNCAQSPEQDQAMRRLAKIGDDEVFIAMIVCGNVPENFKLAASPRKPVTSTNLTAE